MLELRKVDRAVPGVVQELEKVDPVEARAAVPEVRARRRAMLEAEAERDAEKTLKDTAKNLPATRKRRRPKS